MAAKHKYAIGETVEYFNYWHKTWFLGVVVEYISGGYNYPYKIKKEKGLGFERFNARDLRKAEHYYTVDL
jgi:hypothetical protein